MGAVSLHFLTLRSFSCVRAAQMGTVDMRCILVVCVSVCARANWLYSLHADRSFCSDFGFENVELVSRRRKHFWGVGIFCC